MTKLIFGCGYLGSRVARRWRDAGSVVHVVTRSADRAAEFATQGYRPIVADVNQAASLSDLPVADTVLFSVGYDRAGPHSIRQVYVDGLRNVLDALPASTGRVIAISSTGVYGQIGGQWVDESSPCEPARAGGIACLAAERVLANHRFSRQAVVLRLAGIYGPGRVPYLDQLKSGEPLPAAGHTLINLIHVDDAATVVLAATAQAEPPATYCVSDGHPVRRSAYYAEVARLIGAAAPRFAAPDADLYGLDLHAAQRAISSKRVRNARLITDLSLQLAYPTYREGLAAILVDR